MKNKIIPLFARFIILNYPEEDWIALKPAFVESKGDIEEFSNRLNKFHHFRNFLKLADLKVQLEGNSYIIYHKEHYNVFETPRGITGKDISEIFKFLNTSRFYQKIYDSIY